MLAEIGKLRDEPPRAASPPAVEGRRATTPSLRWWRQSSERQKRVASHALPFACRRLFEPLRKLFIARHDSAHHLSCFLIVEGLVWAKASSARARA